MQSTTAAPGLARRVAAEVRASLARSGMGKSDLGRILEISAPTAAGRWSGSQPYSLDDLERLALALEVPILSLLPEVEQGSAA